MNIGTLTIEMAANVARLQADMQQIKAVVSDAAKQMQQAADLARNALVALVGIGSVAAFKGMIDSNLAAVASLKNLSLQTGVAVEQLSGLNAVAKLSGTGLDAVATGMNKLSKGMATATEDSKGIAQAVQALGLNFADFQRMSPDARMQAVAKSMDGFADGAGKTAAAMMLFGKSGAELLPMLKDLANAGELQAKVTTEQAERAKEYEMNLKKIKLSGEAWKKELAMGMLPALQETSNAVLKLINGNNGLRDGVQQLAADGSIAQWTRDAVNGLTWVATAAETVWRVFKALGLSIGAALAAASSGSLKGAANAFSMAGQDISAMFSADTLGARLRANLADAQGKDWTPKGAKPQLGLQTPGDSAAAAAQKISEYEKLIEKIREKTAASNAELTQDQALTEGQKLSIQIMEQIAGGKLKLTTVEKQSITTTLEAMLAAEKLAAAHKLQLKADDDAAKAYEKYIANLGQGTDKLREQIEQQELHNSQIGLGKEAVDALAAAKLDEKAATLTRMASLADEEGLNQRENEALLAQAALYRQLADLKRQEGVKQAAADAAKAAAEEWKRTANIIDVAITNSLMSGFEHGKSFAQNFVQTLKDLFKTLILKPIVSFVVNPISEAIGSVLGLPGAMGASKNMGGSASNLSSLVGAGAQWATGGTAGASGASLFAANATGAVGGDALGALIAGNGGWAGVAVDGAAATGAAAGAAGAGAGVMSTIGAALPWLGAGLLAYSLLSNDKTKPSVEGGYTNVAGFDPGTNGRVYTNGVYGGALDASSKKVVDDMTAQYNSLVKAVGGKAGTFGGAEFTGLDQNGHASAVDMTAFLDGKAIYNRYADLGTNKAGMTEAEVQAAIALASAKSVLSALKATDLGQQINDYLAGVTVQGKSLEEINAVLADVSAYAKTTTAANTTNDAVAAVATTLDATSTAAIDAAKALSTAADAAKAALDRAAEAQRTSIQATIDAKAALDRAAEAQRTSIQATIDAKTAALGSVKAVFDALASATASLYGSTTQGAAMQAAQGRAFISTALALANAGNVMPDAGQLQTAIAAAKGGVDTGTYATRAEETLARLSLANDLKALQDKAGGQLDAAQEALVTAKRQLSDLDAMLAAAQTQVDALNGIDTSIQDLGTALAAWVEVTRQATSNKSTSSPSALVVGAGGASSATSYAFSKPALNGGQIPVTDAAEIARLTTIRDAAHGIGADPAALYAAAKEANVSMSELASSLGVPLTDARAWFAAAGIPAFDVGTNYIPRDMLALVHEGEAVVPKAYNPAAGGFNAASAPDSSAVTAELRLVRTAIEAVAIHTQRLDKKLERVLTPSKVGGIDSLKMEVVT